MPAQLVEITLTYGEESLFCPVCGETILDVVAEVFEGCCPHLLFYMNDEAGACDGVAPRIAALVSAIEDSDDWREWATILPDTAVVFCFLEPGRGGGHDTTCNYYCFDFAPDTDDPD